MHLVILGLFTPHIFVLVVEICVKQICDMYVGHLDQIQFNLPPIIWMSTTLDVLIYLSSNISSSVSFDLYQDLEFNAHKSLLLIHNDYFELKLLMSSSTGDYLT